MCATGFPCIGFTLQPMGLTPYMHADCAQQKRWTKEIQVLWCEVWLPPSLKCSLTWLNKLLVIMLPSIHWLNGGNTSHGCPCVSVSVCMCSVVYVVCAVISGRRDLLNVVDMKSSSKQQLYAVYPITIGMLTMSPRCLLQHLAVQCITITLGFLQ